MCSGIGWYSSVAEHLPTRKGPVFDTLDPGEQRAERVYVKAVSFLLFSVGNSHVYQHGPCIEKEAQEERETHNKEPPRERNQNTQTTIKNSIYKRKTHTSRIVLNPNTY